MIEKDGKLNTNARQNRPKCRLFAMGIDEMLIVVVKQTTPHSAHDQVIVSPSVALPRAKLAPLSWYLRSFRSKSHDVVSIDACFSHVVSNRSYRDVSPSSSLRVGPSNAAQASTVTLP
uniref:Uncharacterized protein n=1 Tax=Hyaloperonospora arabidopsidis (strain Emoy2) TaxID=559515 RepID=M4BC17_HYAAE